MAAIDRMLCQAAEHFLYIGTEEIFMSVSYKKLWKLLIDKDTKKKDLCEKAGISPASVTKMGRNGHVTTEILVKICAALDCGIEDMVGGFLVNIPGGKEKARHIFINAAGGCEVVPRCSVVGAAGRQSEV